MSNKSDNSILRQLLFEDDEDDSPEYPEDPFASSYESEPVYYHCTDQRQIMDRATVIAQLGYFHAAMFYDFDIRQGRTPTSSNKNLVEIAELDRRAEILYGRKIFSNPPQDIEGFFKSIRHIPSARQRYQFSKRHIATPDELQQFKQLVIFERLLPPNIYFAHVVYQATNHPVYEFLPYVGGLRNPGPIPELPENDAEPTTELIKKALVDFDPFDLPPVYQ